MSHSADRDVPRYVFHVQGHSELIGRLSDLERDYAAGRADQTSHRRHLRHEPGSGGVRPSVEHARPSIGRVSGYAWCAEA